jgi:serine/threonine-protein kinase
MPTALDPNRWSRVESLFYAALDLEPAARLEFVQNQSQGDPGVANEVMSLLAAASGSKSFLSQPLSRVVKEVAGEPLLDRLREGASLNHYQIVAKIGAGGMGQVYQALDTRLGRQIALKVLAPYLTYDAAAFRRFQQEAHAASALNHPNILTIFEFGQMEGLHYIASEYIEGPTLRQRLQQGPLELKTAVDFAIQLAGALVAAHASGIIHRDIKPENILLRSDGLVKLVDFGIAKLGQSHADDNPTLIPNLSANPAFGHLPDQTQPGMVLGTLRYMSPEQAQRMVVDSRSDLFSLGAVLYEMLAGTPAFTGDSHDEIMQRIVAVDPPGFSAYGVDVQPELELIVEKALRKERESRYQTARDLLMDLRQFQKKLEFEANLVRAGFAPSGGLRPRALGETPSGGNRLGPSDSASQSSGANRLPGSSGSSPGARPAGWMAGTPPQQPEGQTSAVSDPVFVARPFWLRRGWVMPSTIGLLIVVGALAAFLVFRPHAPSYSADAPRSLAILPFRNLNHDADTDFLQVSLADALISKLSNVRALTVRPSADVKRFRNSSDTLESIAGQLRSDLLLTGEYRKDGNDLKIDTQLTDTRARALLWRHTIQIPYDQLLTVQDRLAQQIIEGLSLKLSPVESQRIALDRPANTTAYEYYLRGVDLYSLNDFAGAIDILNKSIALEPDYALAWAQLGRAYTTHASLQFGGRQQYTHAREAYAKALSLDPGLVDIRVYMANLLTDTGRVEEAVPLLREALTTNPNFAEAHWELGYAYRFAGVLDESVAESEQSRRIDPEVKINSSAINGYLYRGEYKRFRDSIPAGNSGYTLFYRGLAEYYLSDFAAAQADFDRAYALDTTTLPAPIGEGISEGLKHRPAEGLKILQATEARFNEQGVSDPEMLYKLAQGYAVLGDAKSALRVLQQSADGGFFCAPYLAKDPLMNSLRAYPRFKELEAQIENRHDQFVQRFIGDHGAEP